MTSLEQVLQLRFHGSPTILIDGREPFLEPESTAGLVSRTHRTPDGPAGEQLVEALR